MIDKKTDIELGYMLEGGKKIGNILSELLDASQVGTTLSEIESLAVKRIQEEGGSPSFMTVPNYHWATCLCVNEVVVHGIPSKYALREGDVFTIDIGMLYKGFHTDTAWSKIITSQSEPQMMKKYEESHRFLECGKRALAAAIHEVRPGNRIGHISQAIEMVVEGEGYSIIHTLIGHGVGRSLHEDPQVPGFLQRKIELTPLLEQGMTIAIEVIYCQGKGAIVYENDDGWTLSTKDRSLSAVFEHTIAIVEDGFVVVTDGKKTHI
jgi:methionyl aminopeptidase